MPTNRPSTWFQRILLPAIILQSVLIGGGYSTGREVVEYAGKHGSVGWISVVIIFLGFSLLSIMSFELARVFRVYDYKNWIRQLIGRLWPLFDLLVVVMALLVLAVIFLTNLANPNLGDLVLPSFGLLLFATALRFVVIKAIEFFGRNQQ